MNANYMFVGNIKITINLHLSNVTIKKHIPPPLTKNNNKMSKVLINSITHAEPKMSRILPINVTDLDPEFHLS